MRRISGNLEYISSTCVYVEGIFGDVEQMQKSLDEFLESSEGILAS